MEEIIENFQDDLNFQTVGSELFKNVDEHTRQIYLVFNLIPREIPRKVDEFKLFKTVLGDFESNFDLNVFKQDRQEFIDRVSGVVELFDRLANSLATQIKSL